MSHFLEAHSVDGGYLAGCALLLLEASFIKSCRYSTWLGHSEPNVTSLSPVPKKPTHFEVFRYLWACKVNAKIRQGLHQDNFDHLRH